MSDSETYFDPVDVHDIFMKITEVAHPSANQEGVKGNEDPLRKYVNEVATGIEGVNVVHYVETATEPGDRVIVLRREGSGAYAGKSPVILQAHMDMVYNPVNMEFPLSVIQNPNPPGEGKWIKAKEKTGLDSTLGADDGIGVATALAILKDQSLKDYPLECLFTVQEETDMGGAQNFDLSYLTGDKLLNIDAEDLTVIIYGSAGGGETQYTGKISREAVPKSYVHLALSISGLRGGHSGVDINKGRLNAIKVMNQALLRMNKRTCALDPHSLGDGIGSYDLVLYDIKRTDVFKANAIPASAQAIIALPPQDAELFIKDFRLYCQAVKAQNLPEEKDFAVDCQTASVSDNPLTKSSTDTLLCMIQQIPYGPVAMISDNPGVVETSSNLYGLRISGTDVSIYSSNRSSCANSLKALYVIQISIGNIFQYDVETGINGYPSWQPNPESPLLKIAQAVYSDPGMYGSRCETTVIHAGLECGTINVRYKGIRDIDCISIGPSIKNPHSPVESLQIEDKDGIQTVQQFYNCVGNILKKIFA